MTISWPYSLRLFLENLGTLERAVSSGREHGRAQRQRLYRWPLQDPVLPACKSTPGSPLPLSLADLFRLHMRMANRAAMPV